MEHRREVRISKFLSCVLRHQPELIGIDLDRGGWANVGELLAACARSSFVITRHELEFVVKHNRKQRFAFSDDGSRIRAQYGHSIRIELDYVPTEPPGTLFHGTAYASLAAIRQNGLTAQHRQYVHLSPDRETALEVGRRHGQAVVLEVQARRMYKAGFRFFCAPNGIWMTEQVPPKYLRVAPV
jgi:putative RNA 2'-phosphotransferase